MNISAKNSTHYFFTLGKSLFWALFVFNISIASAQTLKPKKKGGGPAPKTGNNTTVKQAGSNKLKSKTKGGGPAPSTENNTTISQSGDNKRFNSSQNSSLKNPVLEGDKRPMKKKMEQRAAYRGTDVQKKTEKHPNPMIERERGNVSQPTDYSNYEKNREKAMEKLEKPSQAMHEYKGEIVVKKHNSELHGKHSSEIDHKNRQSASVDHTKYQGYRKKAFNQKEANMEHLNSQGSAQYGERPEDDFSLEKRKSLRESKERERFEYSGDFLPKAFTPTGTNYSGDIDITGKEKKIKEGEKERAEYSGDKDISARDNMRREKDKEQATYTGDVDLSNRDNMRREKDKEQANYSGDMELESRDKLRRQKNKEIAEASGDIEMRDVLKKAREIRKKEKVISKYSGDILVRTLRHRDNKIRIKAKKIANWEGDIVIAKKRKGAHPSAAYRGGKVANSYKEREKYRKKMLKKYGRNPGIETPNYQKRKYEKPTYDKDEGKIWDVQKYKESKTKMAE